MKKYLSAAGATVAAITGSILIVLGNPSIFSPDPGNLTLVIPGTPSHDFHPSRWSTQFSESEGVGADTDNVKNKGMWDHGTVGKNAVQNIVSRQPTFVTCDTPFQHEKCFAFDGANSTLTVSRILNKKQRIVVTALAKPDLDSYDILLDSNDTAVPFWFGWNSSGRGVVKASTALKTTDNLMSAGWGVLCIDFNSVSTKAILNGAISYLEDAGSNDMLKGITIGSTAGRQFPFKGQLMRVTVWEDGLEGQRAPSCERIVAGYYANKYPELGIAAGEPSTQDCKRSNTNNLCPADGECRIGIFGDSIQAGASKAGADGTQSVVGSESCFGTAVAQRPCTTDGTVTVPCICEGSEPREGMVEQTLDLIDKWGCYSRYNFARSGSSTTDWKSDQWDTNKANLPLDVAVIGGANNDWGSSDTTCANIQTLATDMLLTVPKVLILGGHAQGRNIDHTAGREAKRVQENLCLKNWADTQPNVSFLDFDDKGLFEIDVATGFPSIKTVHDYGDGLHLNNPTGSSAYGEFVREFFE